jgi:hypothetical protein
MLIAWSSILTDFDYMVQPAIKFWLHAKHFWLPIWLHEILKHSLLDTEMDQINQFSDYF